MKGGVIEMKSVPYFILVLAITSSAFGQSYMVFDSGTNIEVGLGADICANFVTINGTYSGGGTLCNGPLPVELSSFTASVEKNTICINWRTETEVSNYGFEVERKIVSRLNRPGIDGSWEKIGFVEGHGNCNSPKQYSFVDDKPYGGSKFQYRLKQIDTDGQFEYSFIVEVEILPDKFALFQNYPNPFNTTSVIKYSIPQPSQVSLKIFNTLGEELETLVNEEKPAGTYEVEFGRNLINQVLTSGVYFYRLQAGNYVETKKMVLLK